MKKTTAKAEKAKAIEYRAAMGNRSGAVPFDFAQGKQGANEEFWVRCWDRRRHLSERISDLAEIGCTIEEISAALDFSPEYLSKRYARELRQGLARLRARLRRLLLESAEGGKVPAQVWLGHLLLGRMEEQRQAQAAARPGKPLADMTTSEMLEEFMESAAKNGRGRPS